MLTQRQIDEIINASRQADEGPTQLVLRVESAVMVKVFNEFDMAFPQEHPRHGLDEEAQGARNALESLAGMLRARWEDSITQRPAK